MFSHQALQPFKMYSLPLFTAVVDKFAASEPASNDRYLEIVLVNTLITIKNNCNYILSYTMFTKCKCS